jgi:hypothetical protein
MASAICSIRYIDDEKEEIWPSTCSSTSGSYLYNATDSSGCELPAWELGDALWLKGEQCSFKYCGGSECVLFLVICAS